MIARKERRDVAQNVEFLDSKQQSNHAGGAEQFGQSLPEEEIPF